MGPPAKKGKSVEDVQQPPAPQQQPAPQLSPNDQLLKNNPRKWSVEQVCDFIKDFPGGSDYAEDFKLQEIDGQALMLLEVDHLRSVMAMSLGIALKVRILLGHSKKMMVKRVNSLTFLFPSISGTL